MKFSDCGKCGAPMGPSNVERIKINSVGLWFHHPEPCGNTGLIRLVEIKRRAAIKRGSVLEVLEAEYYQERLKELISDDN